MNFDKKEKKKYLDILQEFEDFYSQALADAKKRRADIVKLGMLKTRMKTLKEFINKLKEDEK